MQLVPGSTCEEALYELFLDSSYVCQLGRQFYQMFCTGNYRAVQDGHDVVKLSLSLYLLTTVSYK